MQHVYVRLGRTNEKMDLNMKLQYSKKAKFQYMIIPKYGLSDIIINWLGNNNKHNQLFQTWNDFIETQKNSKVKSLILKSLSKCQKPDMKTFFKI